MPDEIEKTEPLDEHSATSSESAENSETITTQLMLPTKYENRYVAFLDVLGWRNLVNKSLTNSDLIPKIGGALYQVKAASERTAWLETAAKTMGKTYKPDPNNAEVSQFSDSIVISAPATSLGQVNLLFEVTSVNRMLFYNSSLLVRGAITAGKVFHKGPVAFGPALTAAYDLEQKSAIYPRIILHRDIEESFLASQRFTKDGKVGHFKTIRRSPDGFYFLDFLQPIAATEIEKEFEEEIGIGGSLEFAIDGLAYARPLILRGLREHLYDSQKWEKYRWLAGYFNEIAEEYSQGGIEPILANAETE